MEQKEKDKLRKYAGLDQLQEVKLMKPLAVVNARALSDRLVLLFKQSKGNKAVLLKGIDDIFDAFKGRERIVIADFISRLTNRVQFGDKEK